MRALLAILTLVAILGEAGAQTIQRIKIDEPGIYWARKKSTRVEPGTTAGKFTELVAPQLVEATTKIAASVGVMFGFQYSTVGTNGAQVRLKFVTHIPQPGIRNPNTGTTSVRSEYFDNVIVGGMEFKGYSFDDPWEIVLGTWTIEVWDGDRKLASQSFEIIAPF